MKFLIVLSVMVAAAIAQHCYAPGTVVTTKSVTTVSAGEGSGDFSLIKSTWELAKRDGHFAHKLFLRFLKTHPEYQKMFSSFADVPQYQLMKNGNFLTQAFTIAAGMDVIIDALGSKQLLALELNHLGTSHFSRGATVPMFQEFGQVLMTVLQEELGSELTPEAAGAFKKAFDGLIAALKTSLKKPDQVPHPVTGLTGSSIADVRRVWESLRANRAAVVNTVFIKLFAANPSLQKAFNHFADVPVAALGSNAEYLKQVDLVADRLDAMIATLDNTLKIMGQFKYMGHSHGFRGVFRDSFEQFGRVFMETLAEKGVSAHDQDAFRAVLGVAVQKIAENMH